MSMAMRGKRRATEAPLRRSPVAPAAFVRTSPLVLQAGVTLLELLATVSVLAVVLGFGVPALTSFFDAKRLTGIAEQVYSQLQQARLESIARSATVYARFDADGGTAWTYGLSHRDACDLAQGDPTEPDACVLVIDDGDGNADPGDGSTDTGDLVLMRYGNADSAVAMSVDGFAGGGDQIEFDPMRGTTTGGEVRLTSPRDRQLRVVVGLLGRLRICTPDGSMINYSGC